MDDKLKAAVALAQDQQSFDKLAQPNPSAPTDTAVPTDYSLTLYVPGLDPYPFGGSQNDRPAITNITAAEAKLRGNSPFQVKGTAGTNWRVVAIGVTANGQNGVVIIGLPLTPVDKVMEHAVLVVVGVGLLTLVLAFFIATWTVARSFRPLAKVEKTAAAIAAGDLSRRVEVDNPHTEVGRLGGSLNAMLAHIEASFAARAASEGRMRRFAADASHELRTPLVTIRGFSELYRHGALATKDDVAMAMGRIESEAKRMGSMVEDLLMLARLDEQRPLQLKPVDLQLLAHDAVVDTKASAGDRSITLTGLDGASPTAAPVQGDEAEAPPGHREPGGKCPAVHPGGQPHRTRCRCSNNACRSSVSVIEIRDHGPGIPEDETNKIFERFYRADTSRTRETGGSGLGLAIVAAIVGSHGGTVRVDRDRRRRCHVGGQPPVPGGRGTAGGGGGGPRARRHADDGTDVEAAAGSDAGSGAEPGGPSAASVFHIGVCGLGPARAAA